MTEADVLARTRAYVTANFLYMRPDFQFEDDDSLLQRRVIDSLGVMEIVGFLEETFAINVGPADVTEANFGTLVRIARYVITKASEKQPA